MKFLLAIGVLILTGCAPEIIALDREAPQLMQVQPGSFVLPASGEMRLQFSEALSLSERAQVFSQPIDSDEASKRIPWRVQQIDARTIAIAPLTLLAKGGAYRLTLARGISDVAGNAPLAPSFVIFTPGEHVALLSSSVDARKPSAHVRWLLFRFARMPSELRSSDVQIKCAEKSLEIEKVVWGDSAQLRLLMKDSPPQGAKCQASFAFSNDFAEFATAPKNKKVQTPQFVPYPEHVQVQWPRTAIDHILWQKHDDQWQRIMHHEQQVSVHHNGAPSVDMIATWMDEEGQWHHVRESVAKQALLPVRLQSFSGSELSEQQAVVRNHGAQEISLKNWSMRLTKKSGDAVPCRLSFESAPVVKPQQQLMIVGQAYALAVAADVQVARLKSKGVCGGVSRKQITQIALLDAQSRVVSSLTL